MIDTLSTCTHIVNCKRVNTVEWKTDWLSGQWCTFPPQVLNLFITLKQTYWHCSHPEYTCFTGSVVQMYERCVSSDQSFCSEKETIAKIKHHTISLACSKWSSVCGMGVSPELSQLIAGCVCEKRGSAPRWWGTAVPSHLTDWRVKVRQGWEWFTSLLPSVYECKAQVHHNNAQRQQMSNILLLVAMVIAISHFLVHVYSDHEF